jgi:hypothetical protein
MAVIELGITTDELIKILDAAVKEFNFQSAWFFGGNKLVFLKSKQLFSKALIRKKRPVLMYVYPETQKIITQKLKGGANRKLLGILHIRPGGLVRRKGKFTLETTQIQYSPSRPNGKIFKRFQLWLKRQDIVPLNSKGVWVVNPVYKKRSFNRGHFWYSRDALKLYRRGAFWKQNFAYNVEFKPK